MSTNPTGAKKLYLVKRHMTQDAVHRPQLLELAQALGVGPADFLTVDAVAANAQRPTAAKSIEFVDFQPDVVAAAVQIINAWQ